MQLEIIRRRAASCRYAGRSRVLGLLRAQDHYRTPIYWDANSEQYSSSQKLPEICFGCQEIFFGLLTGVLLKGLSAIGRGAKWSNVSEVFEAAPGFAFGEAALLYNAWASESDVRAWRGETTGGFRGPNAENLFKKVLGSVFSGDFRLVLGHVRKVHTCC